VSEQGGREGGGGGADTELKTKTPHVNVGKNAFLVLDLAGKPFGGDFEQLSPCNMKNTCSQ